jgi:hypothetical protein
MSRIIRLDNPINNITVSTICLAPVSCISIVSAEQMALASTRLRALFLLSVTRYPFKTSRCNCNRHSFTLHLFHDSSPVKAAYWISAYCFLHVLIEALSGQHIL